MDRISNGDGAMRTDIIVVDNFYLDPGAVREYALKQLEHDFYYPYQRRADVESGRTRCTWVATRFKAPDDCPFKSSTELVAALSHITGEEVDIDHWNGDFLVDEEGRPAPGHAKLADRGCIWNCSFHWKPDIGQRLGDGVHNHVTDTWNTVGTDGWAGLLYLAEDAPLRGGLRLWSNREESRRFDWMSPRENWTLIDDIGNVPNRLILARGDLPHSGASGWGDSPETGRLYQTFFFRTRSPKISEPIVVSL